MPRKRGKTWYTDFYFEGGRHRQRIPGARVRHEAVQAETKIKNDLFQKTYGPPILKDKPLAKFVEEDFLPWAENNKKQPRHDRGVTRIWLELPSLKGKTVNRELIIMSSLFHRAVDRASADWRLACLSPGRPLPSPPA